MKRNIPVELLGLLENWLSDCFACVNSSIEVGRWHSESPRPLGRDRFCHRIFLQYVWMMLVNCLVQCLKWKIRSEGTVRQLWASKQVLLAPDRFLLNLRCGNAGFQ